MTETPLPASHEEVGRRPSGAEPQFCEPAVGPGWGGPDAPDFLGSAHPARPHPGLRGPLGPGEGTDDFLGFVRTRGRVSTPQGSSPIALIQKGDWCGSEFIRHLRNEN